MLGPRIDLGQAEVLLTPEAPGSPMLNRVIGLGLGQPATETAIGAALDAVPSGTVFYVSVEPGAEPSDLGERLAARGLDPGWGWMRFRRGLEPPPARDTSLRLARVADDDAAAAYAGVVCTAYGLPAEAAAVVHRARETPWELWLALDGDEPAGAAGLFVDEGVGYLGFAGTLAEHRGKGAQSLLLAHRIARAAELGCDVVVSETGERRDDLPSSSYRNLVRTGFEEIAVTSNWLGRT